MHKFDDDAFCKKTGNMLPQQFRNVQAAKKKTRLILMIYRLFYPEWYACVC